MWCCSPRWGTSVITIRIPLSPAAVNSRAPRLAPNAASTPSDTSVSIVAAPWRAFFHAARWNGHAAQMATGAVSIRQIHCQLRNCSAPTIEITSTGTPSTTATVNRWRRSRVPASS